jgi:hypothetical protein
MTTWPLWIALVVLTTTHVGMFVLGVCGALFIRWLNVRPVYPKQPAMNEEKLARMADRLARQQVQSEQWQHFAAAGQIQSPVRETVEESFVPSPKK